MSDIFGGLFGFDNDGSMDISERAAELGFIDEIIDDDEYEENEAGEDEEEYKW